MISVKENIQKIKNDILRLEGALQVFTDLEKAGVTNIPVSKNPLEYTEVLDGNDVQSGSEQKSENGSNVQ